MYLAALRKGAN